MTRNRIWLALGLVLLLGVGLLGWMYLSAIATPVVRTATIVLPYPPGVARTPIRIALLSDTHVSRPDMPPERLDRIVDQVNARHPDIILLAGDYLGNDKPFGARYAVAESIAPFARLRAPLGVVAVLGNHDHWQFGSQVAQALRRGGATLLVNSAIVRGPLAIGGVDDIYNGHGDLNATRRALRALPGIPILLAHEPDHFPALDATTPLTLVGHTHCGQVALPGFGAIWVPARYGRRFACGRYDAPGRTMIVSGGVGTSGLPLRLFAPPEFWIITLVPQKK